jgi:hypothetical protein
MEMKAVLVLAAATLFWAGAASAEDRGEAPKSDFWSRVTLEAPVFTRHTPDDRFFNDNNWGLLVDVALNENWSLVGGGFRNSYDRNTAIAGVSWEPLSVRVADARLRFGGMAAVDLNGGYRPFNSADPLLAAFNVRLTAADQNSGRAFSRLGALVTVIPPAPKNGSTAINLALTYRLQ